MNTSCERCTAALDSEKPYYSNQGLKLCTACHHQESFREDVESTAKSMISNAPVHRAARMAQARLDAERYRDDELQKLGAEEAKKLSAANPRLQSLPCYLCSRATALANITYTSIRAPLCNECLDERAAKANKDRQQNLMVLIAGLAFVVLLSSCTGL